METISYNVTDDGELLIFVGNRILAAVSGCQDQDDEVLLNTVEETIYGHGYDWNSDGTISERK